MARPKAPSFDHLRRDAKTLRRLYDARDPGALTRLRMYPPRADPGHLKHADFLHVIAREQGFESWPKLKLAVETVGMDRAAKQQRLKIALYQGQGWVVEHLLSETPDLADGLFGLACALYDIDAVEAALARDPSLAVQAFGPRRPILHLAFSRWIKQRPELAPQMIAVAEALLAAGADVNDGYPVSPGSDHLLSALYGAIGHADNMVLGRWLLEHGADPNDGEALYHATELGHHEGLKLLLAHGADPHGTNALLRAMDFDDVAAVRLLLTHGAKADDYNDAEVGGEQPWVVPALHQAARRGSGPEMVKLLLENDADPGRVWKGATAYGFARVFGHAMLAREIEARGGAVPLSREETLLARAADGEESPGAFIDPERLPPAYRDIIRDIVHLPDRLGQVQRLVALGVEYDRPDGTGVTPVQAAGWCGLPGMMAYLMGQRPDLAHVNDYGGTLLGTILHGSENNPDRAEGDYRTCLELALEAGVALPRRAIEMAGREDLAAFLADWAEAHPGQVV
ncbi:ankyrin repeat domain-containing protein [Thalassococcus sp. BH17M4-6]|uniref:ankyrin repeat domain-containing protein n=1 Tax=Thalassococcus sp. BH17M4-6 TaxID=3413148 RepID=UPI003BED7F48